MIVRVRKAGLLTTIQDLGRWGYQSQGVPVAGPMDVYSHRVANALVGNADDAATLEVTLVGPELEFTDERDVAVVGAEFERVPTSVTRMRAGDRLAEIAVRESGDRHHRGHGGGDLRRRHDKCGSRAGQSELREAHHMDCVRGPKRRGLAENDARKRPAVGVVDDEWYVASGGEAFQVVQFGVGDQIAAGICGAGDTQRGDVGARVEV